MKKCAKCGAELNDNVNFCSSCGGDTFIVRGNGSVQKKGNSKGILIGVVICVLLGIIGVLASGGDGKPAPATTRFTFEFDEPESVTAAPTTTDTTGAYTNTYTYPSTTAAPTTVNNYIPTYRTTTAPAYGEIPLTSDLQYTLNLFLSNFSETDLRGFTRFPESDAAAKFALKFNFINKRENFEKLSEPVRIEGVEYNYRISKDIIAKTVFNYFYITQLLPSFHNKIPYCVGDYYYFQFTGGMAMDDLSVVTRVVQTAGGTYEVYFNLYDASSDNARLYGMSDAQVRSEMNRVPYIRYAGSGMAVVHSKDIYSHNECRLSDYYLY